MKQYLFNFILFCSIGSLAGMEFQYRGTKYSIDEQLHLEAKRKFKHHRNALNKSQGGPNKKQKINNRFGGFGKKIDLLTEDGNIISGTYINRGKKRALLIGQGFPDSYDVLAPFIALFPEYDILMINYRWSAYEWPQIFSLLSNPLARYIYDCTKDVIAAVKYLRDQNQYKSVTGIAVCYSTLIYIMAQAEYKRSSKEKPLLFDSLILDSSSYSASVVAKNAMKGPRLSSKKEKDKAPLYIQQMLAPFSEAIIALGNQSNNFRNLSMHRYLPEVADTPIMFIHGTKDLLVPSVYLNTMLNAVKPNNWCALITENEHVLNHIKSKEMYSYLGNLFIKNANHLHILIGYLSHKYEQKEDESVTIEKSLEDIWTQTSQKARL